MREHEEVVAQLAGLGRAVLEVARRLPEPVVELRPWPREKRGGGPALGAMAAQFKRDVPGEYLTDKGVRCVCGAETAVERPFVACSGGCLRWFMALPDGRVRVAGPYPKEDVAA